MIRSFHYAAHSPRLERMSPADDEETAARTERWATFWYQWVTAACIAGYRDVTEGAEFLPADDQAWSVLLDALLLSKAAYELRYELGSRPDWVSVPLSGLMDLLGGGQEG